ncbi:hypothetical protein N9C10_02900 [Flavobacteriaceae bacterium]|nr:hypothetical protein [Flavobacteriaceae bacterium]
MVSNTATNFENSKHRRIYQGGRSGFFIRRQKKSGGDEKIYGPVAKFRTNADGHSSKISNANRANVPNAIRPAVRKTRKNKGVKRAGGMGAMVQRHPNNAPNMIVNEAVVMNLSNNNNNARGMGGLVVVGPSPNNVMVPRRKARSNKGGRHARPGARNALPMILPANVMAPRSPVVRKTRSNKGVKRGPRKAKA